MKLQWKKLLICEAIPLAVGGASAMLTRGSMAKYPLLHRPPLSPPGWIFPVVWTALFALMGLASYLVAVSHGPKDRVRSALNFYGAQLLVNFLWPTLFFTLERFLIAFLWLVLLWALVFVTWRKFRGISAPAGHLLLPYLAWLTFAAYLNMGVYLLN